MAERQDIGVGSRMRLDNFLKTQNAPDEPTRMRLGDWMSLERVDTPELNETGLFMASPSQIKKWKEQGKIGYFEQAIRQDKTEMIPFNPEGAIKGVKLLNAVNRIKRDKYKSDPEQKSLDINLVNKFLMKSEEERIRGFTIGGRITQGAAALPGFMAEFLLTGGAAAIGRKAISKTIKPVVRQIVKKKALKFTTRVAGGLAGATVRTAAMPHRVVESFAERQVNAGLELTEQGLAIAEQSREKPFVSALKAFGDVVIENFSEVTGPELGKIAGRVVPRKMALGIAKLFKKLHPEKNINTLFTKLGYNGFLEELGEERVGALLRAITGVEDYGADNPERMFDRIIASIPNGEEMLVEAGVLAIPGALKAGAQQTAKIIQSRKTDRRPGEVIIDEKTGKPIEIGGFREDISDSEIDKIIETTEREPGEIVRDKEGKPIEITPIPEELQLLAEEAKKYKTAEEFIDSLKIADTGVDYKGLESLIKEISVKEFSEGGKIRLEQDKITDKGVEYWKEKIQKGEHPPVIINDVSLRVLDGHHRLEAYKQLGFDKIPTVFKQDITDVYNEAQLVQPKGVVEKIKVTPESIKPDVSGITPIQRQIDAMEERKTRVGMAQTALEEIEASRDVLKGRIRKYRDEYLKEELTGIPKVYITKKGGITPDEALAELRNTGVDLVDEVALKEYLQNLEASRKQLLETIKEFKPKLVVKSEITLLADKIKAARQGIRFGTITTKKQIKQLQTDLISIIEKSGIEAKDRAKFIRAIKNIQTSQQLDKILPEIEQKLTTLRETSTSKSLRSKINKELKFTKVKLQAGKPVGKFTPELQTIFDLAREASKLTLGETQEKITANIDALGDNLPTTQQALENRILSLFGGLKSKTSVELQDALDVIKDLKATGRSENLAKFQARQEKLSKEIEDSYKSIVGRKTPSKSRIKSPIEKLRKAVSAPFKTFLGWDNIMNLLTIDDKVAPGESPLEKIAKVSANETAEKKTIRVNIEKVLNSALKAFKLKTNAKLIKQWRRDSEIKSMGIFKNTRGEEVVLELSKAEARKIWMELQDPSLVETLTSEKGNAYSPDMIQAIEEFLTQEDKDFATAQLQFYRDFYNDVVNPIYSDIYGVNLPFNEFYSPTSRDFKEKALVDTFLKEIGFRRSVTTGSLKSRIKNLNPLKIRSDISVLQQHIMEMAHFVSWANKIRQLNAIFTNREIKDVINKKFGGEMQKVISDFMKDFTRGGIDRSKNFGAWDKIRVNFTRAKLSIKTSLLLKQMVSFIAFADDVPLTAFAKGIADFILHPINSTKLLNQSEVMRARGANLTRDIKDASLSDEFSAFRETPSFRNMLMIMTKIGDRGAIIFGGWSVYKNTLEKTGDPVKAMETFENATSAAQQSADLSQLSVWQRGNTFQKMFTMFTSAQNQYFRKEYMAIRNLVAGKISTKKAAKTILIYHFLLPMFFQWVSDFGKWNKDEQLRASILGSFNGIFIIKDILDSIIREAIGLPRFDLSIAPYQIVNGIFVAMNEIDIDDIMWEDVVSALIELDGTIGGLVGLPAEQVRNKVEAIGDIREGETGRGVLRLLGWTEWVIDNNEE